ncbi:methyl-CpG-binding domain protein 2-like isoform X2 [Lineus longissimus]|uniref:methyl-CpG-binding domain protein 2-like isoform X2 n=1 Tax=Lineus longissimus TaxID=88925 RepID=UPI002B4DE319
MSYDSSMDIKKRTDCPGLPKGWKREEVIRKCGLSAGKTDVYYYSPNGTKIRSKPQLARSLGESFDLSAFDFRTGKIISNPLRKRIRHDAALALPIRQTASIFKQPVTVKRHKTNSKTKIELKHGPQEQPKQLFWEKRLHGLHSCDTDEERFKPMTLPRNIQGVGPELSNENLLHSIAAALHLSNQPVTGQTASKPLLVKNPGVHVNADQPMIQSVFINDDDIRRQEQRVLDARRKLQQALKSH